MDVQTETLTVSVTKHAADMLRLLAEVSNGSVDNIADRALRIGLTAIADERAEKLAVARGEQ